MVRRRACGEGPRPELSNRLYRARGRLSEWAGGCVGEDVRAPCRWVVGVALPRALREVWLAAGQE
jgi:hypothetical protein